MPWTPGEEETLRRIIVDVGWAAWGTFYGWSGDDPDLFDCSGLACEELKSIGAILRGERLTADGLWQRFGHALVDGTTVQAGDFVFWFSESGKAIHVEMIIAIAGPQRLLSLGASGGGPEVRTRADAIKANAFVKVRPVSSRGGIWRVCSPIRAMLGVPAPA